MTTPATHHRAHLRTVVIVLAVVLAVVGGAWVAARIVAANTPPPLDLEDTVGAATLDPTAPFDPAGTWTVAEGEAGYRLQEDFGGQVLEVAGRTTEVTGSVTVEGGALTAAEVVVDVAAIATDDSARDAYFRRAMDTSTYPQATFRLRETAALPDLTDGTVVTLNLPGELSMHGAARAVTVEMSVQRTVDGIEVVGRIPVTLEDFGLSAPDLAFVSVDPSGTVEFLALLTR